MANSALEARLQYLESREEANTKDIVRLKKENVLLQNQVMDMNTTICGLRQDHLQASKRLLDAELKCQKMEEDLKTVFSFRESFESQISNLESKVTLLDYMGSVSSLESVINGPRQEVADCKRLDSDRPEGVISGVDCTQSMVRDRLLKMEEHLAVSQVNLEKRLENVETDMNRIRQSVTDKMRSREWQVEWRLNKVENSMKISQQKVDDRLGNLENGDCQHTNAETIKHLQIESKETLKMVRNLIETRDAISNSVTCVSLKPKRKPKTNEASKLCICEQVLINGGYFNEHSCCLEPSVEGDYAIVTKFCQSDIGEIELRWRKSQDVSGDVVGVTCKHSDVRCAVRVVRLTKGEKLWLEMKPTNGNVELYWCWFYAWLISTTTEINS